MPLFAALVREPLIIFISIALPWTVLHFTGTICIIINHRNIKPSPSYLMNYSLYSTPTDFWGISLFPDFKLPLEIHFSWSWFSSWMVHLTMEPCKYLTLFFFISSAHLIVYQGLKTFKLIISFIGKSINCCSTRLDLTGLLQSIEVMVSILLCNGLLIPRYATF